MPLLDTHCHLDLMRDPRATAAGLAAGELEIAAATILPEHFEAMEELAREFPAVHPAVGLHPWWVSDALPASTIEQLLDLVGTHALVGEVGLDFSPTHHTTADAQVNVLKQVFTACVEHPLPRRAISIHAVRAADTVLDLIERTGVNEHAACIFHWFSGSNEELTRARRLGCSFSVGERMLKSKRGRAYARAIEPDRLLLETDYPLEQGSPCSAQEIRTSLERTLIQLAGLRGIEPETLADQLAHNSQHLLNLEKEA